MDLHTALIKDIYASAEKIKEQKKHIFPVCIVDVNTGMVVDSTHNKKQAWESIDKRNKALLLLGRCPKEYKIVVRGDVKKAMSEIVKDRIL